MGIEDCRPRAAQVLAAFAIASCALLAPMAAQAQSDQVIVMSCTNQMLENVRGQWTFTIDLAGKTVSEFTARSDAAAPPTTTQFAITQVTDQKIVWNMSVTNYSRTMTLNRYTGGLTVDVVAQGNAAPTVTATCQRQQKQF